MPGERARATAAPRGRPRDPRDHPRRPDPPQRRSSRTHRRRPDRGVARRAGAAGSARVLARRLGHRKRIRRGADRRERAGRREAPAGTDVRQLHVLLGGARAALGRSGRGGRAVLDAGHRRRTRAGIRHRPVQRLDRIRPAAHVPRGGRRRRGGRPARRGRGLRCPLPVRRLLRGREPDPPARRAGTARRGGVRARAVRPPGGSTARARDRPDDAVRTHRAADGAGAPRGGGRRRRGAPAPARRPRSCGPAPRSGDRRGRC